LKVTADTNVLVRVAVEDDPEQTRAAQQLLADADVVALTLPALCEFVWVLSHGYKRPRARIAIAIRHLLSSANVVSEPRAVAAGLALLDTGGDFADGVIAFEGAALGGDVFASFDKGAVEKLAQQGILSLLVT
jgi:predicted nucleic-acid-binding protein